MNDIAKKITNILCADFSTEVKDIVKQDSLFKGKKALPEFNELELDALSYIIESILNGGFTFTCNADLTSANFDAKKYFRIFYEWGVSSLVFILPNGNITLAGVIDWAVSIYTHKWEFKPSATFVETVLTYNNELNRKSK